MISIPLIIWVTLNAEGSWSTRILITLSFSIIAFIAFKIMVVTTAEASFAKVLGDERFVI